MDKTSRISQHIAREQDGQKSQIIASCSLTSSPPTQKKTKHRERQPYKPTAVWVLDYVLPSGDTVT